MLSQRISARLGMPPAFEPPCGGPNANRNPESTARAWASEEPNRSTNCGRVPSSIAPRWKASPGLGPHIARDHDRRRRQQGQAHGDRARAAALKERRANQAERAGGGRVRLGEWRRRALRYALEAGHAVGRGVAAEDVFGSLPDQREGLEGARTEVAQDQRAHGIGVVFDLCERRRAGALGVVVEDRQGVGDRLSVDGVPLARGDPVEVLEREAVAGVKQGEATADEQ